MVFFHKAFELDPARKTIIVVAGDKAGVAQERFYKALIDKAGARFTRASGNIGKTIAWLPKQSLRQRPPKTIAYWGTPSKR